MFMMILLMSAVVGIGIILVLLSALGIINCSQIIIPDVNDTFLLRLE